MLIKSLNYGWLAISFLILPEIIVSLSSFFLSLGYFNQINLKLNKP